MNKDIDNNVYSVKVQLDKLGKMFKMYLNNEIEEVYLQRQIEYVEKELSWLGILMNFKIKKIKESVENGR